MKKIILLLVLFFARTVSHAYDVSLGIDIGVLANKTGTTLSDGSLVLLIASHSAITSGTFSPISEGLYVGQNSDNVVVDAFAFNHIAGTGELQWTSNFNFGTINGVNFQAGDALAVVWFPTITLTQYNTGTKPTAGTYYGLFTSPVDTSSQGINWFAPAAGTTLAPGYGLNMWTSNSDFGGTNTPNAGYAALQVIAVPEPSSLALMGGGLFAMGAWARRRKVKGA